MQYTVRVAPHLVRICADRLHWGTVPISSLPSLLAVSTRLASPDSAFPPGKPQVKSLCLLFRRSSNTSVPDLRRTLADPHFPIWSRSRRSALFKIKSTQLLPGDVAACH